MGRRRVGKGEVEALRQSLAVPGFILKLSQVEPEPRTVGKAKEGGSLVAQLSQGLSVGRPGTGYGRTLPLERVGKDGRCSRMG